MEIDRVQGGFDNLEKACYSNPHSSEFMCLNTEKDTDAKNLQRPDLNPKPSYSKSRSIGRCGTLTATSVHDVFDWPLLHYYSRVLPSQDQLLDIWWKWIGW